MRVCNTDRSEEPKSSIVLIFAMSAIARAERISGLREALWGNVWCVAVLSVCSKNVWTRRSPHDCYGSRGKPRSV